MNHSRFKGKLYKNSKRAPRLVYDVVCGRGWPEISETSKVYGRLFIHISKDSWAKAIKE
jgi:hypothetical protein